MKLKVEFDLPGEIEEFKLWYHGSDYHSCLWDFYNWMRSQRKHGDGFTDEEAWDMFFEILSANDVAGHI